MTNKMQHNIGTVLQGLVLAAIIGGVTSIQGLDDSIQALEKTVMLNNYRIDQIEAIQKPGH